jgi:hypothetical protein
MDTQPPDNQPSADTPSYRDVQLPQGKQGIDAYAFWFAQQDSPTQKQLIAQGLGPEAREGDGNYTFEVKPDHQAFSYEDTPNDPPGEGASRTYSEDEVQEVVRRVVMAMQLSESPDCLFQARCILIAFGIGDPPTETELAKQRDCSRQFVSKKVKRIQQLFNLSPSQFMRSEAACKAYAEAWQRNQEHRNQPRRRAKPHHTPDGVRSPSKHLKHLPPPTTPPPPTPGLRNLLNQPRGDWGR